MKISRNVTSDLITFSRYQQDGFDLDLTYVTNRVIATSFPSTGVWSLYRFEF